MTPTPPVPWAPENQPWGSHLPALIACCAASTGPILEVGCGHYSTPVLRAFANATGRVLVTIETDPEWAKQFRHVRCRPHYEGLEDYAKQEWGVVFLDHSPGERRAADAAVFRLSADYIVVHDWSAQEISANFHGLLDKWPHARVYDRYSPSTLILGQKPIPEFES